MELAKDLSRIIHRPCFDFVYSQSQIREIERILRADLRFSQNIQNVLTTLRIYNDNLDDLGRVYPSSPEIQRNLITIKTLVGDLIMLLQEPYIRRSQISAGFVNRKIKTFYACLHQTLKYIRDDFFIRDKIIASNLQEDQIIAFILDKHLGFGNRYTFNAAGSGYSFSRHLRELSKPELARTIEVLRNGNVHEQKNGWTVYSGGTGQDGVRIHAVRGLFGKARAYRIYRVKAEHEAHMRDLHTKVSRWAFEAA